MMDFLKIRYTNSCDIAGSVFTVPNNAFYYVIYLPVDVALGTYEYIEEGREDGHKNFVPDFQKIWKKYTFTTLVPEYLYDALSHIMIHDTKFIRTRYEEESRAYNFSVKLDEWNSAGTENIAKITVEFTVDYTTKMGCCQDNLVYTPCRACNTTISITDIITVTDAIYTDPIGEDVMIGDYYLVLNALGQYELNVFSIVNSQGRVNSVWNVYKPKDKNEIICFTDSYTTNYYWDGSFWQPYQILGTLTDSGTQINVKGRGLPNTWIQLLISTDGVTYVNSGTPVTSATFQVYGKTALALTTGVTYYFKFQMYDNNCNYGYSNVISVVKL